MPTTAAAILAHIYEGVRRSPNSACAHGAQRAKTEAVRGATIR